MKSEEKEKVAQNLCLVPFLFVALFSFFSFQNKKTARVHGLLKCVNLSVRCLRFLFAVFAKVSMFSHTFVLAQFCQCSFVEISRHRKHVVVLSSGFFFLSSLLLHFLHSFCAILSCGYTVLT